MGNTKQTEFVTNHTQNIDLRLRSLDAGDVVRLLNAAREADLFASPVRFCPRHVWTCLSQHMQFFGVISTTAIKLYQAEVRFWSQKFAATPV